MGYEACVRDYLRIENILGMKLTQKWCSTMACLSVGSVSSLIKVIAPGRNLHRSECGLDQGMSARIALMPWFY